MKIVGNLVSSLDYRADKAVPHERYSWRDGKKWMVTKTGPGYSQTYEIASYDAEGEAWLTANHDPTQDRPPPDPI